MRHTSTPSPDRQNREHSAEFNAQADERYARVVASGNTISWKEMRWYLEARLAGKAVKRPASQDD